MANTTNFGWETPDDTDLVKDGAAAIRTLGSSIDTSLVDLKGGTTGQILSKTSNTDMDFTWVTSAGDIEGVTAGTGISGGGTSGTVTITNSMATAIDAKGDLIAGTGADAFSRLAVGTNDQVLTADSSTATGLKWAAPSAASGPTFKAYQAGNQTFNQNTWTKIQLNTEVWDTDNAYDPTTNYRFTPQKAGYYQVNVNFYVTSSPTAAVSTAIYKNGSRTDVVYDDSIANGVIGGSSIVYLNGSSDYIEFYAYFAASTTRRIDGDSTTMTGAIWIRS